MAFISHFSSPPPLISNAAFPHIGFMLLFLSHVLVMPHSAHGFPTQESYYDDKCPGALDIIWQGVQDAVGEDPRNGASMLRLFFHDCFVNGCDASVLLEDERNVLPNKNSIRALDKIDRIKRQLEEHCPGIVSCADILAVAAWDAVVILSNDQFMYWPVKLGRLDSRMSYPEMVANLPSPTSTQSQLIKSFADQGLDETDLVVLSGGHSIGSARCTTFRDRIYSKNNIDAGFAKSKQSTCPKKPNTKNDNNFSGLDSSNFTFDNEYYIDLVNNKGLLTSDQQLFLGKSGANKIDRVVRFYSENLDAFKMAFKVSMLKMGNLAGAENHADTIRSVCTRSITDSY